MKPIVLELADGLGRLALNSDHGIDLAALHFRALGDEGLDVGKLFQRDLAPEVERLLDDASAVELMRRRARAQRPRIMRL